MHCFLRANTLSSEMIEVDQSEFNGLVSDPYCNRSEASFSLRMIQKLPRHFQCTFNNLETNIPAHSKILTVITLAESK